MTPRTITGRTLSIALGLLAAAGLAVTVAQNANAQSSGRAAEVTAHQELIKTYCTGCHNARLQIAGLALDTLDLNAVPDNAEIWERAIRKLRGGMMPPPGLPQPERARVNALVQYLEATLDQAAAINPHPGYVALHRINRTEYANAIHEILGLDINVETLLPLDDISDGFDNIANVLKVSPSFLDQYITAARYVTTEAVGSPNPRAEKVSLRAPAGTDQTQYVEGLPLGTRGGFAVEHIFPADGEYLFSISGLAGGGYVRGIEFPHTVLLLIDGEKVFEAPLGGAEDRNKIELGQAPGIAEVRARFEKIPVEVTAGRHTVGVTFIARSLAASDDVLFSYRAGDVVHQVPTVGAIEIAGPEDATGPGLTPSRAKIFTCMPSSASQEIPCAKEIFTRVASEAFRRPATKDDLKAPLAFYKDAYEEKGFEGSIQSGLMAILASPKFLYRAELPPSGARPGGIYPLDEMELASRLSYFLWSEGPDERLLELASQGRLSNPEVLEQQVRRLLRDPRSHSLVTNFAFQWLNMVGLQDIDADPFLFPEYDKNLKVDFLEEMERFVGSIIEENRPVTDLLNADYTFVNERLALHYGIPNVRGTRFRRVKLDDPNRWGLLGKGAVLMVTSYPNRTAPVLRGAWVLERILGTPPAPPPPNVESFPETKEGEQALSVRERMEAHRANPSCNACHGVMDPLGFALENYDAIGAWRDVDVWALDKIDASGQLVDGTPVSSPADLRKALVKQKEDFVRTMTAKLLMYALGRDLNAQDMPTVRAIVRGAAPDDYRFASLVLGIVNSPAFLNKMNAPAEEPEPPKVAVNE